METEEGYRKRRLSCAAVTTGGELRALLHWPPPETAPPSKEEEEANGTAPRRKKAERKRITYACLRSWRARRIGMSRPRPKRKTFSLDRHELVETAKGNVVQRWLRE
ncbi:hypothetical protein BIW11_13262 [Tropilaelaps mercedesae]|uniref:Uncharacterized protein n=1 Tax=Tropilaelaps mercedesae TaxID=418985 RepID=A0A1V9X3L6_9ACAR|nr:hypothetical protein BIW11_13262 [Tropilaelaps mercedesae]